MAEIPEDDVQKITGCFHKGTNLNVVKPVVFLGGTVTSFNASLGIGPTQESVLTVDLINDCDADGLCIDPDGEFFTGFSRIGSPVLFSVCDAMGLNRPEEGCFEFGGILQNVNMSQGSSGRTYQARVVDPRSLLNNVMLVVGNHVGGPIQHKNYYNVYAYYEHMILPPSKRYDSYHIQPDGKGLYLADDPAENIDENLILPNSPGGQDCWQPITPSGNLNEIDCSVFGKADSDERGMTYRKVLNALRELKPIVFSPNYGEPHNPLLCGRQMQVMAGKLNNEDNLFRLDLSGLPDPPSYYRVAGPYISVMDLITGVCDAMGHEFYVTLQQPQNINDPQNCENDLWTIKIVTKRIQPPDPNEPAPSIWGNIVKFDGSAIDLSFGKELRIDKNRSAIFGEQRHDMYIGTHIQFYFGEDSHGNPILARQQTEIQGGEPIEDCGFLIDIELDSLSAELACPLYDYIGEVGSINPETDLPISAPSGDGRGQLLKRKVTLSELDIRTALSSKELFKARIFSSGIPVTKELHAPGHAGDFSSLIRYNYPDMVNEHMRAMLVSLSSGLKASEDGVEQPPKQVYVPNSVRAFRDALDMNNQKRVVSLANNWAAQLDIIHNYIETVGRTYYGKQFLVAINANACARSAGLYDEDYFGMGSIAVYGSVNSGETLISLENNADYLVSGMTVQGYGIPSGAVISSVSPPSITISLPSTAQVKNGKFTFTRTSIIPDESERRSTPGGKYSAPPQVFLRGGGGSGASGTAILTDGFVTGVNITSAGSGYLFPPNVEFRGGKGVGAMAYATVQNGVVSEVVVINPSGCLTDLDKPIPSGKIYRPSIYTHTPTNDGAWVEPCHSVLGLSSSGAYLYNESGTPPSWEFYDYASLDFFSTEDSRIGCFARFDSRDVKITASEGFARSDGPPADIARDDGLQWVNKQSIIIPGYCGNIDTSVFSDDEVLCVRFSGGICESPTDIPEEDRKARASGVAEQIPVSGAITGDPQPLVCYVKAQVSDKLYVLDKKYLSSYTDKLKVITPTCDDAESCPTTHVVVEFSQPLIKQLCSDKADYSQLIMSVANALAVGSDRILDKSPIPLSTETPPDLTDPIPTPSPSETPTATPMPDIDLKKLVSESVCGIPISTGNLLAQGAVDSAGSNSKRFYGTADMPSMIAIPIKSNIETYGPWYSNNFFDGQGSYGGVNLNQDTDFAPWNYGSEKFMNTIAQGVVDESRSEITELQSGSINYPYWPELPMGFLDNGPNLTNISVVFGGNGVTTNYTFQTYTPRFGNLKSLENAHLKTTIDNRQKTLSIVKKNNLRQDQIKRKLKSSTSVPVSQTKQGLQNTGTSARILVGEMYDFNVIHSGDDLKTILDGPVVGTGQRTVVGLETLEKSVLELRYDYQKKAFTSLDSIFSPLSISGDGGLPRFSRTHSFDRRLRISDISPGTHPPFIPIRCTGTEQDFADQLYTAGYHPPHPIINTDLNPYTNPSGNTYGTANHSGVGHGLDVVGRETGAPGKGILSSLYTQDDGIVSSGNRLPTEPATKYSPDYRFLGLKGPLILHSWGYDTDNKPIPNSIDEEKLIIQSGLFLTRTNETGILVPHPTETETYTAEWDGEPLTRPVMIPDTGLIPTNPNDKCAVGLKDEFLEDWLQKPATWPAGPIDLRWDRKRNMWVCPPGHSVVIAQLVSGQYSELPPPFNYGGQFKAIIISTAGAGDGSDSYYRQISDSSGNIISSCCSGVGNCTLDPTEVPTDPPPCPPSLAGYTWVISSVGDYSCDSDNPEGWQSTGKIITVITGVIEGLNTNPPNQGQYNDPYGRDCFYTMDILLPHDFLYKNGTPICIGGTPTPTATEIPQWMVWESCCSYEVFGEENPRKLTASTPQSYFIPGIEVGDVRTISTIEERCYYLQGIVTAQPICDDLIDPEDIQEQIFTNCEICIEEYTCPEPDQWMIFESCCDYPFGESETPRKITALMSQSNATEGDPFIIDGIEIGNSYLLPGNVLDPPQDNPVCFRLSEISTSQPSPQDIDIYYDTVLNNNKFADCSTCDPSNCSTETETETESGTCSPNIKTVGIIDVKDYLGQNLSHGDLIYAYYYDEGDYYIALGIASGGSKNIVSAKWKTLSTGPANPPLIGGSFSMTVQCSLLNDVSPGTVISGDCGQFLNPLGFTEPPVGCTTNIMMIGHKIDTTICLQN